MKFNLTIDKISEAVINRSMCINCGKCSLICPTGAPREFSRTVYCEFPDCGEGRGKDIAAKYFKDAKRFALEPGCSRGCPLGINPQAIANLVKSGDIDGAYRIIDDKNPMPWVCADVCDHVCQEYCRRGTMIDEAIDMKALEGYIMSKADVKPYRHIRRFDERIAVIGGGAAGLMAAFELSKSGYGVTIFEKDSKLGGVLSWGIPDFRLNKGKLDREIDRIISTGINVRYNSNIGEDYSLEDIWAEGFRACLIAVGASRGIKADLKGADSEMVYDSVSLMREVNGGENEGIELGNDIVIIGGGEMAVDTARVLKRMGKNVVCATLDPDDDLQISKDDLNVLEEEGIDFKTMIGPKQIISQNNKVKAVEFSKVMYVEDEKGKVVVHPVKGSEFNVLCDTVIFAIGQKCIVANISNVETYPNGRVKIDEEYRTNKPMIFACGEAAMEGSSIAEAMASGRDAAKAIDFCLHGTDNSEKGSSVSNAPDISIIYPENVQKIKPQIEAKIRSNEDDALGSQRFSEDILKVLRNAGVKEKMPYFAKNDEDGKPKRKVAVIGGGVAGITAALDLADAGYMPVIFEKYPGLGGKYRWLSSHKRIDKKLMINELKKIEDSGIEVLCNVNGGVFPDVNTLMSSGYEAVLFAVGESRGEKPDMKNAQISGVHDAVSLIGQMLDYEELHGIGNKVIVTGCDEMAFDTARLLKDYCDQVTILSPFSKGKLKAGVESVAAALDEGINLVTGIEIVDIIESEGVMSGVKCMIYEKGITVDILCDTIVFADTCRPDTYAIGRANKNLEIDEDGYIQTDDSMVTSMYGVFAISDLDMQSVDAGHAGAKTVECFMEGREIPHTGKKKKTEKEMSGASVKYEIFEGRDSSEDGFETGKKILYPYQAELEASRCMGCGYHKVIGDKCMGCGVCAASCPVNAIIMRTVEEV